MKGKKNRETFFSSRLFSHLIREYYSTSKTFWFFFLSLFLKNAAKNSVRRFSAHCQLSTATRKIRNLREHCAVDREGGWKTFFLRSYNWNSRAMKFFSSRTCTSIDDKRASVLPKFCLCTIRRRRGWRTEFPNFAGGQEIIVNSFRE